MNEKYVMLGLALMATALTLVVVKSAIEMAIILLFIWFNVWFCLVKKEQGNNKIKPRGVG